LFKGYSKLLICGGYYTIDTCEVINLQSPATTCKNPPNFPVRLYGAIGGLGCKENPIICGGLQNGVRSNRCYSLENNEWVTSASMNLVRAFAAAVRLQDSKLFVTGGGNGSIYNHNSAEMLIEEGWESNLPALPVTVQGHCLVTVNSTTVMAIGGFQNDHYSGKTFFFTFGEESWVEGPALKYERDAHSCGRIKRDKESPEMSIIVVGGSSDGYNYLSSVEILHEDSSEWQTGPELPFGISHSQMIEHLDGEVILIGGWSSEIGRLDILHQLHNGGQDAVWTRMDQRLKKGRSYHTAFMVPDNIVDCS
jgi:hypothetical protein